MDFEWWSKKNVFQNDEIVVLLYMLWNWGQALNKKKKQKRKKEKVQKSVLEVEKQTEKGLRSTTTQAASVNQITVT